jgi:hypothetical protein
MCSNKSLVHFATALNGESGTDTINKGLSINPACTIVSVQGQNGSHGNFDTDSRGKIELKSFDSDEQQMCVFGCWTIGENHFWGGPCLGTWDCPISQAANPQDLTVSVTWEHNGTSEVEMRPVYTVAVPQQMKGAPPPPDCFKDIPNVLTPCN